MSSITEMEFAAQRTGNSREMFYEKYLINTYRCIYNKL